MTEQQYFDQYMSREMADSAKRRKRFSPSKLLIYLLLVFWALTTIYPFVWVILNSFREKGMIRKDSFSVPWPGSADFTMDNYLTAFERADFKNAYINSITVSALVTLIVIFLAGLAAYGMVRYRFQWPSRPASDDSGQHDVSGVFNYNSGFPSTGSNGSCQYR